jgi:hypothetical protein
MKRAFAIALLFSLPHLANGQTPPRAADTAPAAKDSCSVSGTVLRQDTGEPLSKATVSLSSAEKREDSTSDVTDAQGHFLLDDLPCHSYLLTVSHTGFVNASYGQRKPGDPGANLALYPGQKMTDLIFKLQRTAVITGRISDENGELVEGAMVRIMRKARRGRQRYVQEAGQALTNDLGEYRVFGLEPGRYFVCVSYNPWSIGGGFGPPPPPRWRKKGYPMIYYPDTTDPSRAQTVVLNPGDELAAMDFRLQLTPMNTVSGRVLNLPGNPARRGTNFSLIPRGSDLPTISWGAFESFSADGTFAFYAVPPGQYYVDVYYSDPDSRVRHTLRHELELASSDMDGLVLAITPTFNVGGRMVWDGNKSDDFGALTLFLHPTDENAIGWDPQAVKPDGSFQFRNLSEGEYHPVVNSTNEACYLKSARAGTSSMVDGKLAIHSGGDSSLEFVVSCRAAQISGQVLSGDSLPAAGVFVALVPEARLRDSSWNYSAGKTDQNGRFLLKTVRPGDYKLFSWASVEDGDWQDADFLKPYEDKGVSVHLEEGDHKSVDLTLVEPTRDAPVASE